ncbi:MAG: DUF3078 domain-containing protein [Flavobacteriaceae bacterium]|nr:DUF3078 domain-containing protein [Flavobacteriaceae bacterium]
MKKLCIAIAMVLGVASFAQTKEELQAKQAPKKDSIAKLQGEVDAIQAQIDALPGWRTGAFGTIGANIQGFNDWYSNAAPNSSTGNIGVTVNGFANLIQDKYFWRNSANVNLAWVKNDNEDDPNDSEDFDGTTDVFTISSLYGYRLSDKWAISTLGEYRTSIINNFNDPGFLDLGVGATWTPLENLVVVIHPLNYNFVFADNDAAFDSSAGAKIVADYTDKLGPVNFKSNLSTFQSYKEGDLSNWTWINSFGYTFWKGIGLGFEFGLRGNKQEALNNLQTRAVNPNPTATFGDVDNKVQSYWLFGINYSL